jgi:hypothetical protein
MKWKMNTPVLGLAFDGVRMSAAVVAQVGGQAELRRHLDCVLTLDPLAGDPELAGQEVRNQLHAAGIRETRCVLCVPLKWVLTTQADVPELTGEDLQSFLDLHAEREFPFPPNDMCRSISRYALPEGTQSATIAAITANNELYLQRLARAAGLRLVSIVSGLSELAPPEEGVSRIDLHVQDSGIGLQISAGGGIAVLRLLEEAMRDEHGRNIPDADAVMRQLRISLGKVPLTLQHGLNRLYLHGSTRMLEACASELEEAAAQRGLEVVLGSSVPLHRIRGADTQAGLAVFAACNRALGRPAVLEFMPPRTTRIQRVVAHMSARGTLWLGMSAAAIVFGVGGAFWLQAHTLKDLEGRWEAIRTDVERVEALQTKLRKYRPWCDDTVQSLSILNRLAESFPETGDVWAQSVVVTNKGPHYEVSCTANARASEDRLELGDRLLAEGVQNLLAGQVRENQFSFRFEYKESSNGR